MGANNNSDLHKCGELLIDIKKIKFKTKSYIFHCVFCSADCDQLKKFTKHLEDEHLNNFEDDVPDDTVGELESDNSDLPFNSVDIKLEQHMYIDESNDNAISDRKLKSPDGLNKTLEDEKEEINDPKSIVNDSIANASSDPLMCKKRINEVLDLEPTVANNNALLSGKNGEKLCVKKNIVSNSKDFDPCSDDAISCDDAVSKIQHNESGKFSDNEIEPKRNKNVRRRVKTKNKKCTTSDSSSDDSRDSDFDFEKELGRNTKPTKRQVEIQEKPEERKQKKSKKELVEDDQDSLLNTSRIGGGSKRILKQIFPTLIPLYKKYESLWQVDNIAFGVKPKKVETLLKMAEELNLSLKRNLSIQTINRQINYLNLVYSKDKKLELMCKTEKKEFIPKFKFYMELSFLCESQGPFLCSVCNEIVPKYDPYCQHMAKHNGTLPFICASCGMGFKKFEKYVVHKKRHLGLYNFNCEVCGKGYPFQSELDWHLTSHTGVKPFLCSICGERFRSRQNHANHMLRHENRFRYECYICKRGFNNLTSLNAHIKCHLNIRDIRCKMCDTGFTHTKYLRRHEKKYHID